ncbi:glycerophosphodiester phosphodiesterase family protein [Anseongella ginsenosidimutans]|nr:glycerophosphodiester phosphodiesterase family protein [Anseongella ginsenosidimutans]
MLFAAFLAAAAGKESIAQSQAIHAIDVSNARQLHKFFQYTGNDIPLISGHRGGMTEGYPENCIPSFENTLRHTPAFFEIDPRLTKDSVIILMHDATLERTTNGTGKVSDYTWEELKKLRLKDKHGNLTEFRIPTLAEVIEWSKGKTIINLDKKDVPLEMTADILEAHKATANVMCTVHSAEQALYYYKRNPKRMFSAFIRTPEELEAYEKTGIPWKNIMAYIGPKNSPEAHKMLKLLHARGVKCMISAAPSYDKLPDSAARASAYREIIQDGTDVIESDLPIEAAAAIRELSPEKAANRKFFRRQELKITKSL